MCFLWYSLQYNEETPQSVRSRSSSVNEVKQGPSRMRRTFSHESNRDSQLGDKIRDVLESASGAANELTGDGSPSDQGGFETPKAVGLRP